MKNITLRQDKSSYAGIDIGSSKITCAIVGHDDDGTLKLLGIGTSPSTGIRKGSIIHRDQVISELEAAISSAETMAGVKVTQAYCSISGVHIRGINTSGAIAIHKSTGSQLPQEQEIQRDDVTKALEMTKNITFPPDRNILHVLPQEFIIDTMTGIKDPVGMTGRRLEARVHLVTTAITAMTNLINCVEELGVVVLDLVFHGLASAIATLDKDEMDLGVACVDIGAETTEVTVYYDGGVRHTGVIPIGAASVTNDIAVMLQIPKKNAEAIKVKYASAKAALASAELDFEIPDPGSRNKRKISEHELSRYAEARMVEIIQLVSREIAKADLREALTYGLVITGGGAELKNLAGLAEEILDQRVRIGLPAGLVGIMDFAQKPQYACAVGLALWPIHRPEFSKASEPGLTPGRFIKTIGRWFKEFF